ncbi:ribosome biogenesis protein Ssf2p [Trichomonascus vanleenenianus]|uniref:ribosome biogenesis protein Ssf2p n=1 Tax=Trichomonascus vanleenenianus TaxID=2268995 RepID=UPI003EC9B43C
MGKSGARRARTSKKRTHAKLTEEEEAKIPKSMVLKLGDTKREVTHTLAQLVRDFRLIMQPHTAAKLKERKSNRLRDFVTMAGPLGVTHLFMFSVSLNGNTSLRIARTPRGPTLHFKVTSYSLCKDIHKFLKTPKSVNGNEYLNPPLLVMNGFKPQDHDDPKEQLLTSMFQNMFPPISAQRTNVGSIKRVLMVYKNDEEGYIDLRHYMVETKLVDGSRQIRKLQAVKRKLGKKLPNLARAEDISDYLLDPAAAGYTSESEVEEDAVVDIQQQVSAKKKDVTQRRAVKLVEMGPRMRLELRKIEDGMCEGKTLFHSRISKSAKEEKEQDKLHAQKRAVKEKRRKEQEENVKRKKEAVEGKMSRTKRGILKAQQKEQEGREEDSEGDDDVSMDESE